MKEKKEKKIEEKSFALNINAKLGPQIDALIASGTLREDCLVLIAEYLAQKPDMKASAEQHYQSRPGHFLKDGSVSQAKEASSNGKTNKILTPSADTIASYKAAARMIFNNPLDGCPDNLAPLVFHVIHSAFLEMEEQLGSEIFPFAAAAMKRLDDEAEAEKEQAAMALLIKKGYKIAADLPQA